LSNIFVFNITWFSSIIVFYLFCFRFGGDLTGILTASVIILLVFSAIVSVLWYRTDQNGRLTSCR